MEIHAHVPKLGKTPVHWLLEGLFIVRQRAPCFFDDYVRPGQPRRFGCLLSLTLADIESAEALLLDLYRHHLPTIRNAAGG